MTEIHIIIVTDKEDMAKVLEKLEEIKQDPSLTKRFEKLLNREAKK